MSTEYFHFFINIYGYNSSNENRALFEKTEDNIVFWLNKYGFGMLCMGGYFNIAPDNVLDHMPPKQSPI